ncbi:IS256 family transposase, variant Zn-binding type [Lonepinella koalarum]|uniref:IS256 family transposase, variant Zn-binding type n=1 Tax=Lonepinella koalarum TaxID=53417 RepID=UPI001E2E9DDE|nr:transposase [Lonepinella koalarum]
MIIPLKKQTLKELSETYQCSIRTIQRHIKKAPKSVLIEPEFTPINIIMDVTFFSRKFGVMVFMNSLTDTVIYHQIVKTEKAVYYKIAINKLREKGYKIQSITCDGKRGLLKDLFDTPIQLCHFHQVAMVIRKLTRNPKSEAGKELKNLVKTLKNSTKNTFYRHLNEWYQKHKNYLLERSEKAEQNGRKPFKHKQLRSAYFSLKRHENVLFTFEKYPELKIEKTTNRLEGLFKELKKKLAVHSGLKTKNKILFIQDFLNKKSCYSVKENTK